MKNLIKITNPEVFTMEAQHPRTFSAEEKAVFEAKFADAHANAEKNYLSLDAIFQLVVAYGEVYVRNAYPVTVHAGIYGNFYNHLEDTDYEVSEETYKTHYPVTSNMKSTGETWLVKISQLTSKYVKLDGSDLTEDDLKNAKGGLVIISKPGTYDVAFKTPFDLYVWADGQFKLLAIKGSYINVGVEIVETEDGGKKAVIQTAWKAWAVSDEVFPVLRKKVTDVTISL